MHAKYQLYIYYSIQGPNAFFTSLGISVGNAAIPGSLAVIVAYVILYYLSGKKIEQNRVAKQVVHTSTGELLKHPQGRKFTAEEKSKVIEVVANNLLKVVEELRHSKYKDLDIQITGLFYII